MYRGRSDEGVRAALLGVVKEEGKAQKREEGIVYPHYKYSEKA